jgi:gephyrin
LFHFLFSSNLTEGVLFVFEVVGAANAGDELINFHLNEGQCVKINTGAPVPLKSDAVIQIEDTVSLAKDVNGIDTQIEVLTRTVGSIKLGQDIRPIGFDIKPGECVIRKNTIISAPQIGICATVGALELEVYKVPTVALISTGNELVGPDKVSLKGGQIRDSNKALLYSALKSFGILNVIDAGVARDEPNSVLEVFRNGAEKADVIISTGGVSMGDKVISS